MQLQPFAGHWRKVSGDGPDQLTIDREGDSLAVWEGKGRSSGTNAFRNINGGESKEKYYAGLIAREYFTDEATFANGKLEAKHTTDFRPGLGEAFIPTRLVERRSLELDGRKLTYETEDQMQHRELLWAGPFGAPTDKLNTTDIADPVRPLQRGEYVKD
jgi:hypothetical protein